ncbi:MAG: PQQ-binding-like beta-propeller repeat protein [Limisphaerales bacterium]
MKTTLVLFLAPSILLGANNWPSFRGINGRSIGSGDPPVRWDIKTGKNIRWKKPVPGLALSSPIIWGNKLFLTTAIGTKPDPEFKPDPTWGYRILREKDAWKFNVLCLDKHNGKQLWEKNSFTGVPKQGRHSESSYANPTPATDGKRLVVSFGSHGIYCYDLTGKQLWKNGLGLLSGAPSDNHNLDWGYSSSPIIHAGKVIVQCDTPERAFIAVLDIETGKETLSINRRGTTTWATPAAVTRGNDDLIICNGYQNAACFNLKTGERVWWLSGRGDIPVPRPIIDGRTVYLTAAHGGRSLHAIDIASRGDLTPTPGSRNLPEGIRWWSPRQGSYIPTPILHDGILYVANERGIVTAFNPVSGTTYFTERLNPGRGGMAYGSPVAAGNKLFIPQNDGRIHVIQAGRSFRKLATNEMQEQTMTSPAIADGKLYIRTRGHLYCITNSP